MAYMPSTEDINMLKYRSLKLSCKVVLLDKQMTEVGEITGQIEDGTISIDADSDIRRTFTATIYMSDISKKIKTPSTFNELVGSTDEWVDKYVRIYIGYHSPRKDIRWWAQGVYAFSQNGFQYNETTNHVSISCVDLVSQLDGTLNGQLVGAATKIPVNSDIRSAIIETLKLGGFEKFIVDYWNRKVPYDLEYGTGVTVWEILKELRDLYYPFEMYFDDDTFVCKEIPSGFDDPVVLDTDLFKSLVLSEDASVDYTEIKNCVEVFGAVIESDVSVTGALYDEPTRLLTIDAIGISPSYDTRILVQSFTNFTAGPINIILRNVDSNNSVTATYGPYVMKAAITDKDGNDVDQDASVIRANKFYVIKFSPQNSAIYFLGQEQPHAMVKLVDTMPSAEEIEHQKIIENCDNLKFVCVNDPSNATNLYNSRFTIEKIGQRNKTLSGAEYDNYVSDESAMEVCEYEHWKRCRLTDTINVKTILIPWLDVNQKISYAPDYLNTNIIAEYMVKKINITLGEGTMDITLCRYYPYYPYIVQNKY